MSLDLIISGLQERVRVATEKYGGFASTHEALGVAVEEWDEFRDAVRANDWDQIVHECCDLAAVLIRIAADINESHSVRERSGIIDR